MYLVYANKRAQKGPKLEVLFVVKQWRYPWRFGEHLPESWRHFETTLDQVADAEHPDKTLQDERHQHYNITHCIISKSYPYPVNPSLQWTSPTFMQ